jgi:hypothetical protein
MVLVTIGSFLSTVRLIDFSNHANHGNLVIFSISDSPTHRQASSDQAGPGTEMVPSMLIRFKIFSAMQSIVMPSSWRAMPSRTLS